MIYVTHYQTEALTFADKVVVMYDGQVVQTGTPAELFERPAHTFVGYFIGSPGMNVLPARVEGTTANVEGVDIPLGASYPARPGRVEIGVRPEFVSLSRDGAGLPVRVRRIEDVGRHKIVRADVFGREINVVVPEGAPVSQDMNRVAFDPGRIGVYVDDRLVEGRQLQGRAA